MYLYDTNTISELRKRDPDINVVQFNNLVNANHAEIVLSVITYGEILKGIYQLKNRGDIQQASVIERWYQQKILPNIDLALPFDKECTKIWGELMAKNPHNPIDKQLAATAMVHDLILVTRNVKDIQDTGVKFINPFEPSNDVTSH